MPPPSLKQPAIVLANNAQFSPGQRMQHPHVESRMLVWCKAGKGLVTVNGMGFEMDPGRYLVLPWGHRIDYQADRKDPFLLAGIHIIPDHAEGQAVRYGVAHRPSDPLANSPVRKDIRIPSLTGIKQGTFRKDDPLPHLAEYIVRLFIRSDPSESQVRQMAQQLVHELLLAVQEGEVYDPNVPPELERLKQYILFNMERPVSLSDLTTFSGLSASTIGRLFRKYLQSTPVTWILRVKMERAAELLRTRRLSVAEVGEAVGIKDPYYFSKCFRRITGKTPLAHRRAKPWM